jgi:hypothetical protein
MIDIQHYADMIYELDLDIIERRKEIREEGGKGAIRYANDDNLQKLIAKRAHLWNKMLNQRAMSMAGREAKKNGKTKTMYSVEELLALPDSVCDDLEGL